MFLMDIYAGPLFYLPQELTWNQNKNGCQRLHKRMPEVDFIIIPNLSPQLFFINFVMWF